MRSGCSRSAPLRGEHHTTRPRCGTGRNRFGGGPSSCGRRTMPDARCADPSSCRPEPERKSASSIARLRWGRCDGPALARGAHQHPKAPPPNRSTRAHARCNTSQQRGRSERRGEESIRICTHIPPSPPAYGHRTFCGQDIRFGTTHLESRPRAGDCMPVLDVRPPAAARIVHNSRAS